MVKTSLDYIQEYFRSHLDQRGKRETVKDNRNKKETFWWFNVDWDIKKGLLRNNVSVTSFSGGTSEKIIENLNNLLKNMTDNMLINVGKSIEQYQKYK